MEQIIFKCLEYPLSISFTGAEITFQKLQYTDSHNVLNNTWFNLLNQHQGFISTRQTVIEKAENIFHLYKK